MRSYYREEARLGITFVIYYSSELGQNSQTIFKSKIWVRMGVHRLNNQGGPVSCSYRSNNYYSS